MRSRRTTGHFAVPYLLAPWDSPSGLEPVVLLIWKLAVNLQLKLDTLLKKNKVKSKGGCRKTSPIIT